MAYNISQVIQCSILTYLIYDIASRLTDTEQIQIVEIGDLLAGYDLHMLTARGAERVLTVSRAGTDWPAHSPALWPSLPRH